MEAIEFEGQSTVLAKDQPQYQPLPVHIGTEEDGYPLTACFKFSPEELAQINETGVIWVGQLTFGKLLQPIRISTQKPF